MQTTETEAKYRNATLPDNDILYPQYKRYTSGPYCFRIKTTSEFRSFWTGP